VGAETECVLVECDTLYEGEVEVKVAEIGGNPACENENEVANGGEDADADGGGEGDGGGGDRLGIGEDCLGLKDKAEAETEAEPDNGSEANNHIALDVLLNCTVCWLSFGEELGRGLLFVDIFLLKAAMASVAIRAFHSSSRLCPAI
jgi:hypothetical protein